jgi:hypothetical protein
MKISELLFEEVNKRGMIVQTLQQFVNNPVYQDLPSPPPTELDEDEQPIAFVPKGDIGVKFNTSKLPSAASSQTEPKDISGGIAQPIEPSKVAQSGFNQNAYFVKYKQFKQPASPSVMKPWEYSLIMISRDPIYVDQKTIDSLRAQAEQVVKKENPELEGGKFNAKVESKVDAAIKDKVYKEFINTPEFKNNPNIVKAMQSGKLSKADFVVTRAASASDREKLTHVHGSSVTIIDEQGKPIVDLDALAASISRKPDRILSTNTKMKKSIQGGEQLGFVNIGIPAIAGLVYDQKRNQFMRVVTCPGAGYCKSYCYATAGGYIQYKNSAEGTARKLNYYYNDPEGFKNQVIREVKALIKPGIKQFVRWHDSGDFFENAYLNLAYDIARAVPEVTFYAYTKVASVANDTNAPDNWVINFSKGGAKAQQEEQVNFSKTKYSVVVPQEVFVTDADVQNFIQKTEIGKLMDLYKLNKAKYPNLTNQQLAQDELVQKWTRKYLVKQFHDRLEEDDLTTVATAKKRIADHYQLNPKTVITYDEMTEIPEENKLKYNVMVRTKGDGDWNAARRDVHGTYLLIH